MCMSACVRARMRVCVLDIVNAEKGWVFFDACRTGPVTVEQEGVISPGLRAGARQPAGPVHPDEMTAGVAQACLRPPRERKHLIEHQQPAIYLSVWLTVGYTWYSVHPRASFSFEIVRVLYVYVSHSISSECYFLSCTVLRKKDENRNKVLLQSFLLSLLNEIIKYKARLKQFN